MTDLIKIDEIKPEQIATICDHTFLETIEGYKYKIKGCDPLQKRTEDFFDFMHKSIYGKFKFAAVCVRGNDTARARRVIDEAKSKLVLAVTTGFPDGRVPLNQKDYETLAALENGADEIDFVIHWGELMLGHRKYLSNELRTLENVIKNHKKKSKAIFETALLTEKEIEIACRCADDAGIDYVKTSTGYTGGATPRAVSIMKDIFPRGVKASGGINTGNVKDILYALSGRNDGLIYLDPNRIRIGEGSFFKDNGY